MLWGKRPERFSTVNPVTNTTCVVQPEAAERSLKLLSFNIQVGIRTSAFREYVTNGWKHLLPHENRHHNLRRVAEVVSDYDVVALQEVDSGSLRSDYVNQVEFLARQAEFPFWYAQTNRALGPLAQHGNGLLTRLQPSGLEDHKLPGAIPGRGAMIVRIPYAGDELVVVMLHLSLGERSRRRQLSYIAEQIQHERQVVVMGDMNMPLHTLLDSSPLAAMGLQTATAPQATYPAWQPTVALDHVLVSDNLQVQDFKVLGAQISDHLPVAVEVAARTRPSLQ
ncbi:MAG: endonuclease/exonuclease/phosphatase family protein [Pseudomonadota bacterium]